MGQSSPRNLQLVNDIGLRNRGASPGITVAFGFAIRRSFAAPPLSHLGPTARLAILSSSTPARLPIPALRGNPRLPPARHQVSYPAGSLRETPRRANPPGLSLLPEKSFPSPAPRSGSRQSFSPRKNPSAPSKPSKVPHRRASRRANRRATTPLAANPRAAISR